MASYYIRPSNRSQEQAQSLLNNLIQMGFDSVLKENLMKSELEQKNAMTPPEKKTTSQLNLDYDKLQQKYATLGDDLDASEEKALVAGDVKKIKEIGKAKSELGTLRKVMIDRVLKENQAKVYSDMKTKNLEARTKLTETQGNLLNLFGSSKEDSKLDETGARIDFVKANTKRVQALTKKALTDADKKGVSKGIRDFWSKNYLRTGSYEETLRAAAPLLQDPKSNPNYDKDKEFFDNMFKVMLSEEYKAKLKRLQATDPAAAEAFVKTLYGNMFVAPSLLGMPTSSEEEMGMEEEE